MVHTLTFSHPLIALAGYPQIPRAAVGIAARGVTIGRTMTHHPQRPSSHQGVEPRTSTGHGGAPDAGVPDAGVPDVGAPDVGVPDVGAPWAEAPSFDVVGHLRRLRRVLDLSQRELAARLGISRGRVGDAESGRGEGLALAVEALGLAGWRLVVVDEEGSVVAPMADDGLRSATGNRYAAHLDVDVLPGRTWPIHWGAAPRSGQEPPVLVSWQRARRDEQRARDGIPADHPGRAQVQAAEAETRRRRRTRRVPGPPRVAWTTRPEDDERFAHLVCPHGVETAADGWYEDYPCACELADERPDFDPWSDERE